MGKKLFILFLGFTLLTGIAALVIINVSQESLQDSPFNRQQFDEQLWKSYHLSQDRDSARGAMANALKARLLAEKPSREAVLSLLGPADMENSERFLSYHLGMWSKHRSRIDTFDITFDANGQLAGIVFSQH